MCVYIYIYIYIHIHVERERERDIIDYVTLRYSIIISSSFDQLFIRLQ